MQINEFNSLIDKVKSMIEKKELNFMIIKQEIGNIALLDKFNKPLGLTLNLENGDVVINWFNPNNNNYYTKTNLNFNQIVSQFIKVNLQINSSKKPIHPISINNSFFFDKPYVKKERIRNVKDSEEE